MKKILIIGAGSAIARETAKLFARDGAHMYLCDINEGRLESVKSHLKVFGDCKINYEELDVNDFDKHETVFQNAEKTMNGIDIVFIAHGTLPDQEEARKNVKSTLKEFAINGTSVISLSTIAANYFEEKGKGTLAVISSVAGDRGRQSNYIYGAAKGAVTLFLEGLRNRLSGTEINILTIKPGMVDTPMTAHIPKGPLFSKPEDIAKKIYDAILKAKDTVYVPGYWFLVMTVIKHIPESIFKKMKL